MQRSHVAMAFLLLGMPLAGCLDGGPPASDLEQQTDTPAERDALTSPAWSIGAWQNTTWHEGATEGFFDVPELGATNWVPRDVTMEYLGVHGAYDEWGRSVPSHIFRYTPMSLYAECRQDGLIGCDSWDGEWRPTDREYYFDAADGRYLGRWDDTMEGRNFPMAYDRGRVVAGLEGFAFIWMLYYPYGAPQDRIPAHQGYPFSGNYTMTPVYGFEPLPTDGTVYKVEWEGDQSQGFGSPIDDPLASGDTGLHFAWVEGELLPDWVWFGNEDGSFWYDRLGPELRLEGPRGGPLPPADWPRSEWQPVEPTLPIVSGFQPDLLAPPSADRADDWADMLHDRLEALMVNPWFIEWQLRAGTSYVAVALTGWPPFNPVVSILEQLPMSVEEPGPITVDSTSVFWLSTGPQGYVGWVHTDDGEPEDEAEHISYERGGEAGLDWSRTIEDLPALVDGGDLMTYYPALAPVQPRDIWFMVGSESWADLEEDEAPWREAFEALWFVLEDCFVANDDDPVPPKWWIGSASTGQVFGAGNVHLEENGCWGSTGFRIARGKQVVDPRAPGWFLSDGVPVDPSGRPIHSSLSSAASSLPSVASALGSPA